MKRGNKSGGQWYLDRHEGAGGRKKIDVWPGMEGETECITKKGEEMQNVRHVDGVDSTASSNSGAYTCGEIVGRAKKSTCNGDLHRIEHLITEERE